MLSITRIIAAAIALLTLLPIAGAQASDQDPPPPSIQPLKPLEVKWVLRPGQSSADTPYYMGWETVDHDDLTYPGPRVP